MRECERERDREREREEGERTITLHYGLFLSEKLIEFLTRVRVSERNLNFEQNVGSVLN